MADSCRRVLEIEVPLEVVSERVERIAGEYRKHAKLAGFRPGKAPMSVVRQRYRDDIKAELLRDVVPEYVQAQAKDNKWDVVGNPSVSDIVFDDGSPLKFKATLEVLAEFELKDYDGIEIEVDNTEVVDKEVDETLSRLQNEGATFTNVDEDRPLKDGDFASIVVMDAGLPDDEQKSKAPEVLCEIGAERTLKEFSDNLRGAKAGEERTFPVSYPEDSHDQRVAGKTFNYKVKVLGIKAKQLPELNDDFAKELGDFDSIETIKNHIREDISKAKDRESAEKAKGELRSKLAAMHDFPVPDILVDNQVEKRLETFRRQVESQGMNLQGMQLDWNRLRVAQRDGAIEDVKCTLILAKIADVNNIEVDSSDVSAEMQKIAAIAKQPPEAIEAYLTRDGGIDRIKSRLRVDKTLEYVYQHSKRKIRTEATPEKES